MSLTFQAYYAQHVGHKFIITNNITNHIKEYQCKNCNKEFTNVFSGGLEILNFKNRKANTCLSAFFKKKQLEQAS